MIIPACTSVVSTMWSNPVFSYLLGFISALSTFTNLKSFAYVTKTFDTSNNLFNILAKDSLAAAICSAIFSATNFINIINEDLLKSKLGCVVHFAGIFLPLVLLVRSCIVPLDLITQVCSTEISQCYFTQVSKM